ncbi:sugar-transfer associated ATP-grasp domain-containing protein [Massilia jejuensis]|uniref:Sugar-transfer associated ATP-grasp domain-containing protein n=1 Tax=Massilia jejuensis TaxID=648894 RepID=A0ABW0PL77_9BURK
MKLSKVLDVASQYMRAQRYALSSIRRPSDMHLLWGPLYARTNLGLGAKLFSLYSLADVPKHTWSDYLDNEPLKKRYAAIASKEGCELADNKIKFFEHCSRHAIPTANIVALITRAPAGDSTIPHVLAAADLARVLAPGEYFVKPASGSHGKGAFSLSVTTSSVHWSGGHSGSFDDLRHYCEEALAYTRALIVQPKLSNHHVIKGITQSKGLSTIRVVTIRHRGRIDVIAGAVRIVVGESDVDNFSHGASGNLVAAVDIGTGEMITSIGSKSKTWPAMQDVAVHPGSGAPILGVMLPCWPEVLALVTKAHESIEGLHTVGWDVAILEDGPVIVEANWRYDIDILQVAYKRGFRKVIDEKLDC